MFVFL